VNRDSITTHERFAREQGLSFPLLSDPDASMMSAYWAFGEKVMYGKVTTGTIRSTVVIGPDGTVVRHWPKVAKAEGHPAEVLDFLRKRSGG
jgi:peroxiredoxin Q/BCP